MTDMKQPNRPVVQGRTRMTPSEAFVESLVAQGVTDVFGIVGSAYMDALDIFPAAGIRFISVAHDRTKLIPYVIGNLLRGKAPKVSSGKRKVDCIYVDDTVDGLLAAAKADRIEGQTIDIGSGTLHTVRRVVERLVRITGAACKPLFGALVDRPLETERAADVDGAEALIGWRARTGLDEGLTRTVACYMQTAGRGSN